MHRCGADSWHQANASHKWRRQVQRNGCGCCDHRALDALGARFDDAGGDRDADGVGGDHHALRASVPSQAWRDAHALGVAPMPAPQRPTQAMPTAASASFFTEDIFMIESPVNGESSRG